MSRRVRVKAIRREKPDISLYAQALVALARQLQDAEQQALTSPDPVHPERGSEADGA